jgi:2-polyprenyl-3-methyl-5-hydroxy-6-metoxy-1,4-benzoquinol methylase
MSETAKKKSIDKIKRTNRGKNVLGSVPQISVPPLKKQESWTEYREALNNLYTEEVSSEYLADLLRNVSLSGDSWSARKGFKTGLARILSKLSYPFSKVFAFNLHRKISEQQRFNSQTALIMQRLLDLNKKSNDILCNKIEQMEEKFDGLIGEVVYKYLVNFTRDLVARMDILYGRLDENFISHDVELENLISWKEGLKSELQDLRGVLGAQRRAFDEIYSSISATAGKPAIVGESTFGKLKDLDYLIFENRFRGSSDLIIERQRKYVRWFKECKAVLDVACGRGEFLELMKQEGIPAEGVDINQEMVAMCSQKGLKVTKRNALEFLNNTKEKFDGVFCSNLVEHLDYSQLRELLKKISLSLREEGVLVIETINPECLSVFASALYLDLTHIRPLHPLGLEALLEDYGFHNIELLRTSPVDEEIKLEETTLTDEMSDNLKLSLTAHNRNFHKLNKLLFGYMEYGIAAKKIKN